MLSVRQEFMQSVVNDNTMSLTKRLVWLRRSLNKPYRYGYGNFSIRMQHLGIIHAELIRRIKDQNVSKRPDNQ